jgi:hypothetical protein
LQTSLLQQKTCLEAGYVLLIKAAMLLLLVVLTLLPVLLPMPLLPGRLSI